MNTVGWLLRQVLRATRNFREARARSQIKTFARRVKKDAERRKEADKKLHRNLPTEYFIKESHLRLNFLKLKRTLDLNEPQALAWAEHQECTARILGYQIRLVPCAPIMGDVHHMRAHLVSPVARTFRHS